MASLPDWLRCKNFFGATRGQSELVGAVLILGLTLTGSALVVAFGSSALTDAEQNSQIGSAEHAMTQFDSRTSLVGLGGSSIQRVNLGASGTDSSVHVQGERGWIRIRVINASDGSVEDEVMNQSLGIVEYANGDTTVAYQGGGVWKQTAGGTTMVSPPEFHYHERTLTLPLVVVEGEDTVSDRLEITRNGSVDPMFPLDGDADRTNPLTEGKINVTVGSAYYEAWGQFFEQRTGGEVSYDQDNESVTITLVVPSNRPQVAQALASTSSEELVIKGSGGSSFTNSYNSSVGDYDTSQSKNGTIITSGGVEMSGGAAVKGDLVSGSGTVRLQSSNAEITGNISYGGSTDIHKKATVGGWIADNGSAPEIDHVDNVIDAKLAELESDDANNNGDDTDITDENVLNSSEEPWELTAGNYYLEELDLGSDDTLVLNLSDGDIVIAVDDDVTFDGTTVKVVNPGDNETNIYMDGNEFTVTNDANVSVPGDTSSGLWVYGPPDTSASFASDATFVGVLYAPDTDNRQGEVVVDSHAEVFGALVGGRTTLQSGGTVHFDQSLTAVEEAVPGESTAPKLTYLHVTVNRVNVTAG